MRIYISIISIALMLPTLALSTDWDSAYVPTKKEWIEVAIQKDILRITDLWKKRIAVNVVVYKPENVVAVVFTSANGEAAFSRESCASYVSTIRSIAQNTLAQYAWAKMARLEVQCAL
ncbi:MAG: hypothetical protein ACOVKL_07550 [Polynucleobacter sp.]